MSDLLLGIDIGATGIKAGFFHPDGRIAAIASRRNAPVEQHDGEPGWMVWDAESLWATVCQCIREGLETVGNPGQVKGVACTGFGADGVPMTEDGNKLYPIISWHCKRTLPQWKEVSQRLGDETIFNITGYHNYPINTLNRLLWFQQNRPDVLERTYRWLQVQDYIAFRLSGEFSTECTIASTTMMLDLAKRTWSANMLDVANIDPTIFPAISEAGTQIGAITSKAALETGLAPGTPVVTGGHDCEIGVLGAGVNDPATFIDITGTWEILIATLDHFQPDRTHFDRGLDFECHALPGQWICQSLMIAGAVIEWVRDNFYRDVNDADVYDTMFAEAVGNGGEGLYLLPSFMPGMGPDAAKNALGAILGLTTTTSRGAVTRAALEGLCFQLRQQCDAIGEAVGRKPERLRVVGGAQKNPLWLQMKADTTGLPVETVDIPEVTLLGVALLAGTGAGLYKDINEAFSAIHYDVQTTEPNAAHHEAYEARYQDVYRHLAENLEPSFTAIKDQT